MARPTKFNEQRAAQIIERLKAGNTRRAASLSVGVSEDSLARWIARNAGFAEAISKAEAEAEMRNVLIIQKAASETWTAGAWWLERRRHQDWGRKDTLRLERMKEDDLVGFILGGGPEEEGSSRPQLATGGSDREAERVGED